MTNEDWCPTAFKAECQPKVDWVSLEDFMNLKKIFDKQVKRIAELEATIEFAKYYKGIEGQHCPLCTYRNGVFIKYCTPHEQLHELRDGNQRLRDALIPAPDICNMGTLLPTANPELNDWFHKYKLARKQALGEAEK